MSSSHHVCYPQFLLHLLKLATDGSKRFYIVMFVLTAIAWAGVSGWVQQTVNGMALTAMTDHVSWGLYIANFTFGVGLAAGAVMMVVPPTCTTITKCTTWSSSVKSSPSLPFWLARGSSSSTWVSRPLLAHRARPRTLQLPTASSCRHTTVVGA